MQCNLLYEGLEMNRKYKGPKRTTDVSPFEIAA